MLHLGTNLEFEMVLTVLEATALELGLNCHKVVSPGPKDDVDSIKVS